jgi:hypothetical protein
MTQDEIIEMARQAGLWPAVTDTFKKELEAFAKLVAAHTLMNIDPSKFISHQEGIEAGRLAEREACAKLCAEDSVQAMDFTGGTFVGGYFAKRIMERNEHGAVSDQQV